jgi:GTPase, putative
MIVGIPNVGKSTVINKLREVNLNLGGRPMNVGPIAGVTRAVSEKLKISYDPPIYLYDTPGVLAPIVTGPECALRLALCGWSFCFILKLDLT